MKKIILFHCLNCLLSVFSALADSHEQTPGAPGEENPWAVYGNYIDRVVMQCVNELTPNWTSKLAGYDVFIWDQCYAMENSLRIEEQ